MLLPVILLQVNLAEKPYQTSPTTYLLSFHITK